MLAKYLFGMVHGYCELSYLPGCCLLQLHNQPNSQSQSICIHALDCLLHLWLAVFVCSTCSCYQAVHLIVALHQTFHKLLPGRQQHCRYLFSLPALT